MASNRVPAYQGAPESPTATAHCTGTEGGMDAQIGDYAIRGVQGEYPCKPDTFEATDEAVNQ